MQDANTPIKQKIRFDATVNLGHIITFVGFLAAGFGAWSSIDKRVTVLEEGRKAQATIDAAQDARFTDAAQQIKEVLQRLDRQVERLNDRLDRGNSKAPIP